MTIASRARPAMPWFRRTVAAGTASALILTGGAAAAGALPGANSPVQQQYLSAPILSGIDATDIPSPLPPQGSLIRSSPLDSAVRVPDSGLSYRILYSTLNHRGEPAVSTGTVSVPPGTPPPGGWPAIIWGHGTTGIGDDCAPSTLPSSPSREVAANYPSYWLRQGYAVVATDYAGLGTQGLHAYLNTQAAANSMLDAATAAHGLNLRLSRTAVALGHSQGGAAALAAASAAPTGNGALDFRGAVAVAPAAHTDALRQSVRPSPETLPGNLTAYAFYALAGFRDTYPDLDIDARLTGKGRELLALAERLCSSEMGVAARPYRMSELFAEPLSDIPGFDQALDEYMRLPSNGYSTSLLIVSGLDDDLPPEPAVRLAEEIQESGGHAVSRTYPGATHVSVLEHSLDDVQSFIGALFSPNPERALDAAGF
ncbi:alpha/beta fold hydrolase [Hoyosella subflava]|nr:alpha/beta fold hydrolase [Hoyosella subflava]